MEELLFCTQDVAGSIPATGSRVFGEHTAPTLGLKTLFCALCKSGKNELQSSLSRVCEKEKTDATNALAQA